MIKYETKWDWEELSQNSSLPWSEEFIEKFKNKWDWNYLSNNPSLPWSENLVFRFNGKWNWRALLFNKSTPCTLWIIYNYLEKFEASIPIWDILKPYIDDELIEEILNKIENEKK